MPIILEILLLFKDITVNKVFIFAALALLFTNTAHAFGESPVELQEKAARVMAQEMQLSRAQINQLKVGIAKNAPSGDVSTCTNYGFAVEQNMTENMPSISDKLSEAIRDFATWGCVAKNGQ